MPDSNSKRPALTLSDERSFPAHPPSPQTASSQHAETTLRAPATTPSDSIDTKKCIAISAEGARSCEAQIIREEPLEIQIHGRTLLVTMRTPGHDQDLAHGILLTERIVESAADVQSLYHCSTASPEGTDGNRIQVLLRPGCEVDFETLQRNLVVHSGCGICGKTTLAKALATAPPIDDATCVAKARIVSLPRLFAKEQFFFAQTGGAHAAALFTESGELLALREDVGRHNAVDKVLGWASRNALLPLARRLLMVSGRISFEIVQKALVARVPIVVGISAPTSLAVALAEEAGMTLVGFLREKEMNIYGNLQRIHDLHK